MSNQLGGSVAINEEEPPANNSQPIEQNGVDRK